MPPRSNVAQKQGADMSRSGRAGSSRQRARGKKDVEQGADKEEIDIQAAIQEMIDESHARITEALQARHEQLLEQMMKIDAAMAAQSKRR